MDEGPPCPSFPASCPPAPKEKVRPWTKAVCSRSVDSFSFISYLGDSLSVASCLTQKFEWAGNKQITSHGVDCAVLARGPGFPAPPSCSSSGLRAGVPKQPAFPSDTQAVSVNSALPRGCAPTCWSPRSFPLQGAVGTLPKKHSSCTGPTTTQGARLSLVLEMTIIGKAGGPEGFLEEELAKLSWWGALCP